MVGQNTQRVNASLDRLAKWGGRTFLPTPCSYPKQQSHYPIHKQAI
jgi:hypothetical protein